MASKERALKYRCKNSNKQMKINILVHIADTIICKGNHMEASKIKD